MTSTTPSTQTIRKQMRQRRQQTDTASRRQASARACRHLLQSRLYANSRHIAAFFSNDAEIDLDPLLTAPHTAPRHWYLPVLRPMQARSLWFLPWQAGDPLQLNRYGIPEPVPGGQRPRPTYALDLVLLPLVAFDAQGNRIGMGGGYYDRTFAFRRRRRHWRGPVLIGVAYGFQEVPSIAAQPWDITLDGILTENGLRLF